MKFLLFFIVFLWNTNLSIASDGIVASIDNLAITNYDLNNYKKMFNLKGNVLDEYLTLLKKRLISLKHNVSIGKQEKESLIKNYKQLLEQLGIKNTKYISKEFIYFIVESNYLWSKYVETGLKPSINITDEYVNNVTEYLVRENIKTKYNLSEIVLYYNNLEQKIKTKEKIDKIYSRLNYENFQDVAKSQSQSLSASAGGDVGWVFENDLNKDLVSTIKNITDISEPVCTGDEKGMCIIFKLNSKEKIIDISEELKLQIKNFILIQMLENKIMDLLNNTKFTIKYYDNYK